MCDSCVCALPCSCYAVVPQGFVASLEWYGGVILHSGWLHINASKETVG